MTWAPPRLSLRTTRPASSRAKLCTSTAATTSSTRSSDRLAAALLGTPIQRDADVARLSAGPIGNLEFYFVSLWPQILLPEFKQLLGQPGERILPAGLLLIDRAAPVGEKAVRKPPDLDFSQTIADRPVYDRGGALQPLLIGDARRALQLVEQRRLLRFDGRLLAHVFGGLCGLGFGHFLGTILG